MNVDSATWTGSKGSKLNASDIISFVQSQEENLKRRTLATVQVVKNIRPIEDADAIEVVEVLGWEVVSKKGLHKVGDKVVYLEVDSLIPLDNPEFEFLRKRENDTHARIKTIKLRGQVSQGLIIPLSVLPDKNVLPSIVLKFFNFFGVDLGLVYDEGEDVSGILGITKYDPEGQAERAQSGGRNWPQFLHKTDEVRVQTLQWLLDKYQGEEFYITEKLDGSSMTVYLYDDGDSSEQPAFGVCSRNLGLSETAGNKFWDTARKLDLENKLRSYGKNIALQGELVGPGIQGNKYNLAELRFYVFNAYDIDKMEYLDVSLMSDLVISVLHLNIVPWVANIRLGNSIPELVEMSKGQSKLNEKTIREGLVFRPFTEAQERKLGRVSFKVINPDFLLKNDKD